MLTFGMVSMSNIQKKPHIPKDQKFFDYIKEAWDVEEYEERNIGVEGLGIFKRLHVIYTHKDNKGIRFVRTRNITIHEIRVARYPEALVIRILDEMHTEIQDEIIQYLTPKEV